MKQVSRFEKEGKSARFSLFNFSFLCKRIYNKIAKFLVFIKNRG